MFLGEARVVFQLRTFFKKIDIQLELWMQNAREVLLYIHGYTVSYKSALKRAAQLKYDLEFGGLVILYSWPTMGQPLAYHRDGRVIKRTAQFLHEFITIILGEVSFSKVHILAHSMGNRALIAAMSKRPYGEQRLKALVDKKGVLKNVILAAADETLENFEGMLQGMLPKWYWQALVPKWYWQASVPRPLISVYSSACDWPLFVSGYINWHSRLGNTDSLFGNHSMRRCDQHIVDVIDASGVRCNSPLQHSYHAEAPEVLDDIQKVLTEHKRAVDRPFIERLRHNSQQGEWVFHAFVPTWWEKRRLNGCTNMVGSEKVERMYQHGGIREG
jgi:esterase/lipase superfamily enzyme